MIKLEKEVYFKNRKRELLDLVKTRLEVCCLEEIEKTSIKQLVNVIEEYTFSNRLEMKGHLSHLIIDSLTVDYSVGERVIEFDNKIK